MREKFILLLVILILVPISAHADSIIVNGSFESPTPSTWDVYASIPGWSTISGSGIEVRNNHVGTAYDGHNFVELDSHDNSAMSQTVTTEFGDAYTLSFAYAPRVDVPAASNGIELYFNDLLLTSITGNGYETTAWSMWTFPVIGNGLDIIKFVAIGQNDSLGGSIDMVSMERANEGPTAVPEPTSLLLLEGPTAVPEPTSLLLLGTGLGVIGLAAWRRRK
jgi:hypothetical protein